MIRLPRGKTIQKHIDTTYVRLDGVLHSLSRESFGGYVRIVSEDAEGVLFLRHGHLVAGLHEGTDAVKTGPDALLYVLSMVDRSRAYLDIHKLEPDLLAAVMALTHTDPITLHESVAPADVKALLETAESRALTGAALAETAEGSHYFYFAGGELLGEFRPDIEEWTDVPPGIPPVIAPWKLWHEGDAHTLRTIDLETERERVFVGFTEAVERFVPGFGGALLDLEVKRHGLGDPRMMQKSGFVRLADGLYRRSRLVIGSRRAGELSESLRMLASSVVDAGI